MWEYRNVSFTGENYLLLPHATFSKQKTFMYNLRTMGGLFAKEYRAIVPHPWWKNI